jgi:capsular polysaccharide biosynthesis protein
MNEAEPPEAMREQPKCPQCGASVPGDVLGGLCPACLLQQGASTDSGGHLNFKSEIGNLKLEEVACLFPRLEIISLIGKGGMGAVYKARQPALDRFVALKVLPSKTDGSGNFGERFNREARALARLSHPNIIAVHEFGQADGFHYFIMEFVDGLNLRQLQQAGRLSPREALQIVPQVCDALQYAHDEGVVHRDIKPENVLIDRRGRVKIADFGLAKILGVEPGPARLTGEGHVMGTLHYMAPEQIERPLEVDHRADIYSLGVVLYEMLTSELPLGKFPAPSQKAVRIDVRLDEVVLRALEKQPEQRYQQASQVKSDLETIAGVDESAAVPDGAVPSCSTPAAPLREDRGGWAKATAALRLGGWVALLISIFGILATIAVTVSIPKTYSSTAHIAIRPEEQNLYALSAETIFQQSRLILSPSILGNVAADLELRNRWAQRATDGELTEEQKVASLRQSLQVRQSQNTSLLKIIAFSEKREEAALVANKVAEVYMRHPSALPAQLVDPAEPSLRPVRPNVFLNLFVGSLASVGVGLLLGLLAGGMRFLKPLSHHNRGNDTPSAARPDPKSRRAARALLVLVLLISGAVLVISSREQNRFHFQFGRGGGFHAANREQLQDFTETIASEPLGPVIERTLDLQASPLGTHAIDLETGRGFTTTPRGMTQEEWRVWFEDEKIDLLANFFVFHFMIYGPGLDLTRMDSERWESASTADILKALRGSDRILPYPQAPQGTPFESCAHYTFPAETPLPLTLAVRTGQGSPGIMQITAIDMAARSLKLRYKLAGWEEGRLLEGRKLDDDLKTERVELPSANMPSKRSKEMEIFMRTGALVIDLDLALKRGDALIAKRAAEAYFDLVDDPENAFAGFHLHGMHELRAVRDALRADNPSRAARLFAEFSEPRRMLSEAIEKLESGRGPAPLPFIRTNTLVLSAEKDSDSKIAVDLDGGRTQSFSGEHPGSRADLEFSLGPDQGVMRSFGTVLFKNTGNPKLNQEIVAALRMIKSSSDSYRFEGRRLPAQFFFRTRGGMMGRLELETFSVDPPTLTIRYAVIEK